MWVACFDWACRRLDVAAPGIEPAGQGHCLSRVCATAALTWGVTPPPALPPGTRRQGDAVIFCRGMPLFMAGSVGQSAFVITATFWSHGRATVSPGRITECAGGGTRGHFAKHVQDWRCSMSPFSIYLKTLLSHFHLIEDIWSFAEQWH